MRNLLLVAAALSAATPIWLASGASAQQTVTFLCAAPVGHVCQFAVKTGGSQMTFALPSGERKEVASIIPHADKYCVCDPGPVTAPTARRLSSAIGAWARGSTSIPDKTLRTTPARVISRSLVEGEGRAVAIGGVHREAGRKTNK
jgi:hypothetical protein